MKKRLLAHVLTLAMLLQVSSPLALGREATESVEDESATTVVTSEEKSEEKSEEQTEEKSEEQSEEKSEEQSEEKSEEKLEEQSEEKSEEQSEEKSEEQSGEKLEEKSEEQTEEKSEEKLEEQTEEKSEEQSEEKSEEQSEEKSWDNSWDEIATLSLADQLVLSQIMPMSTDVVELGTSATPFLLSNVSQLQELATYVNKGDENFNAAHYKLTQDVSLSSVANWTPIGSNIDKFQGTFDGNGKVISDMTISTTTGKFQGFFGDTENATIKNLGIVDCDITAYSNAGGVAGETRNSTITNCYVTGKVHATYYGGGLVGWAGVGTISNSYSSVTVTGTSCLGGLAGGAFATFDKCYATGSVSGSDKWIGGLVGDGDTTTIKNCVALNPSISGGTEVNRILARDNGNKSTLTNNYAWDGMTGGSTSTDATSLNGADLTYTSGLSKQFSVIFSNDTTWTFTTNGLPILKNVGGDQSNEIPFYMQVSTEAPSESISTSTELYALAVWVDQGGSTSGKTYTLTADIDLSGVEWIAIGNYHQNFQGTFDGAGHVISNLKISTNSNYQGLFGYVKSATIKNLGVVDCSVSGGGDVGAVVGNAYSSRISNCYATGKVSGSYTVGGLVGCAQQSSTVEYCYATVDVKGSGQNVGGLVGYGYTQAVTIKDSYATGAVSGKNNVGGLVGYAYGPTISNTYATGAVNGTTYSVGGLAGDVTNSPNIKNSFALNPSVIGIYEVSRVFGSGSGTFANNYAWSGMTVTASGSPVTGTSNASTVWGADLSYSSRLTTQFSNIFDDTTSAWEIDDNKLPILKGIGGTQSSTLPSHITGLSSAPPTSISTVADLQALATWVNGGGATSGVTYTLMNDLDLSGVENWTAIGTAIGTDITNSFQGIFDGGGHVISNMTINKPSSDYQGLFGYVDGATIKNLGIEDCNVSGADNVGALVGYCDDSTISLCYATGMLTGGTSVGGLVGRPVTENAITNCYSTATVSGENNVGGLVGAVGASSTDGTEETRSVISNCYATGNVNATTLRAGGLVGLINKYGTVENSLSLNTACTSGNYRGRVAGQSYSGGILANNYAWKEMLLNESVVTTTTSATNTNGENCLVVDGIFLKSDGSTLFGDSDLFDLAIWNIPTASNGDYMLLPTLKNVGNDVPSIYLVQTIPSEVTVTFAVDGGSTVANQETTGNKLANLPTPTKTGYVFDGWYLEDTFETKVDTSTVFVVYTTVYAKWLITPTANDFDFVAPTPLEYDGTSKTATVTSKGDVTGIVTVYYEGVSPTVYEKTITAPTEAGEYKVFIDVTADGEYIAISGLTDETWTFEITKATYPNDKTTSYAQYGASATVDLTVWGNLTGAKFGIIVVDDTKAILVDSTATLSGNTLSYALVNDETKVEQSATVTIPVTSTNYEEFKLIVTITMSAKQAQSISYSETTVEKHMADTSFTNPLTQTTVDISGGAKLSYSSSNETVATVDTEGEVTLVGVGLTTITAMVSGTANYTEASATYTLNVSKAPAVSFDVTTGVNEYEKDETFDTTTLEITVTFLDGTTETVAYKGSESKFTFNPTLETALTTSDTTMEITYETMKATYPIKVLERFDLDGTVHDFSGTIAVGAVVTLYQNGTVIATQTTDENGNFSFGKVLEGTYNLVVSKDGLSKAVLVILESDFKDDINLPNEGVNSTVSLPVDGEIVAVGGVDKVAEAEATKEALAKGDTIEVSAIVTETTEASSKTKITEELSKDNFTEGENITVTWLEIDVKKKVTPSGGTSTTTNITETDTLLEIVVDLPLTSQSVEGYAVYREHDGTVDILYLGSSGERIELSADNRQLIIYAQKFSTYALVVSGEEIIDPDSIPTPSPSPSPSVPEVDSSPNTGNTGSSGSSSSSSTTYYTPTLKDGENGTASINPVRVASGKTVTITVTPDEGYDVDYVTVVTGTNKTVTVTDNQDGTYTFTQPSSKVTIEVFYKEKAIVVVPETEDVEIFPERLFYDVETTDWFYPYVKFAVEHELMAGIGDGLFAPEDETLRGMVVTMLYSMAGKQATNHTMIFDDVATTDYFYLPCLWASAHNIVSGVEVNKFAPNTAITREQICLVLYQYAKTQTDLPTDSVTNAEFTDNESISDWASEAVNWCYANGIVSGYDDGCFAPNDSAKRSEIATIFTQFVKFLEA